tara:strand:+ start:8903 stop:9340 length:438 start_codon:yes stop_codon:yes gene_type:complete
MKRVIVILSLFSYISLYSQEKDSISVYLVGEFSKPSKYILNYGDSHKKLTIPKGYYGKCFKFKLLDLDKEEGELSLNLGRIGWFGKYKSESMAIQLFERRILILYNDKILDNTRYFNYYWYNELDPKILIPELYGILKELKTECK